MLFENADRRRKASEELRMVNLKLYIPLYGELDNFGWVMAWTI